MSFACDAYVLGSSKVEVVEKEPRFFFTSTTYRLVIEGAEF